MVGLDIKWVKPQLFMLIGLFPILCFISGCPDPLPSQGEQNVNTSAPHDTSLSRLSVDQQTSTETKETKYSKPLVTFATLPGAPPQEPELEHKIQTTWNQINSRSDYQPRTHHLRKDGTPKYVNRLFLEGNPYLLQHAHNPVNWYPWGTQAFDKALELQRPILLSVGYSTCHWCHVMEEESFENLEIAKYINENYIAIKVDREERPDVDSIYMSAVIGFTGSGGWPMTVWLTPDGHPFFGGTYFPPHDSHRGVGFLTLLQKLKELYVTEPQRLQEMSENLVKYIRKDLTSKGGSTIPPANVLHNSYSTYESRFDTVYGSLLGAPKFPSHLPIRFLLRYYRRTGKQASLDILSLTLKRMAEGGMYDQIGGGFHRYSTDRAWLIPHFEKMLYDNALLIVAYLEAYQVTGDEQFSEISRDTLKYIKREMTSPQGAFYSATDADSLTPDGHREEGYYFTWTPEEVQELLGEPRASLVNDYFGITDSGNLDGRTVLHISRSWSGDNFNPLLKNDMSSEVSETTSEVSALLKEIKPLMLKERSKRPQPLRDEKILAAWNGLMISAFARAALILGDDSYTKTAEGAARFILDKMLVDGRLMRSHKDGKSRHNGYLNDYAFFIAGLLDLFEATGEINWLKEAISLDNTLKLHYEDKEGGSFFTSDDHEKLLVRSKPDYDGAVPSGNSVQAMNLLRLYEFTSQKTYFVRAQNTFKAFGHKLTRTPTTLSEMLLALDYYYDKPKQIVIVTPKSRKEAEPFLKKLSKTYLPNQILVVVPSDKIDSYKTVIPMIEHKRTRKGMATAYVCEGRVCKQPTEDAEVFANQIQQIHKLK